MKRHEKIKKMPVRKARTKLGKLVEQIEKENYEESGQGFRDLLNNLSKKPVSRKLKVYRVEVEEGLRIELERVRGLVDKLKKGGVEEFDLKPETKKRVSVGSFAWGFGTYAQQRDLIEKLAREEGWEAEPSRKSRIVLRRKSKVEVSKEIRQFVEVAEQKAVEVKPKKPKVGDRLARIEYLARKLEREVPVSVRMFNALRKSRIRNKPVELRGKLTGYVHELAKEAMKEPKRIYDYWYGEKSEEHVKEEHMFDVYGRKSKKKQFKGKGKGGGGSGAKMNPLKASRSGVVRAIEKREYRSGMQAAILKEWLTLEAETRARRLAAREVES